MNRVASVLVRGWWLVLPAVMVVVALFVEAAPAASGSQSNLVATIPSSLPAVQAEKRANDAFGLPFIARVAVVQRDPNGLSLAAQARTVEHALQLNLQQVSGLERIAGALPITNLLTLFPSSSESGTTAITYLLFSPDVSPSDQDQLAHEYANRYMSAPSDALVGVTGTIPLRQATGEVISSRLRALELASIAVLVLATGLAFRAPLVPVVVLVPAGLAEVGVPAAISWVSRIPAEGTPHELRPVITVLTFGIIADYSIFYLSSFRSEIGMGTPSRDAALRTAAAVTPIVAMAATTISATTLALLLAQLKVFSSVGPGMAAAVFFSGMIVIGTVPALLGLFGSVLFWPAKIRPNRSVPTAASGLPVRRVTKWAITRRGQVIGLAGGLALLVLGLIGLTAFKISIDLLGDLPSSEESVRAADAAAQGFAPGIIAPTVVLVEGNGVGANEDLLATLQRQFRETPGVAGVLGPASLPAGAVPGLFVSNSGNAARFVVILDESPYAPAAISTLGTLQATGTEALASGAGPGATLSMAGDSAISSQLASRANSDLRRVLLGLVGIDALMLILYLRALVVPVLLLLAGGLAVMSAIGLTIGLSDLLGYKGLTYYVPFGTIVLLAAFTTDYTLFVAGRVRELSHQESVRRIILRAVPRTTVAVGLAGVTLALTFGMLVIVPLNTFREVAIGMASGILLNTIFVDPVLVPALLTLISAMGRRWPPGRSKE